MYVTSKCDELNIRRYHTATIYSILIVLVKIVINIYCIRQIQIK